MITILTAGFATTENWCTLSPIPTTPERRRLFLLSGYKRFLEKKCRKLNWMEDYDLGCDWRHVFLSLSLCFSGSWELYGRRVA